MRPLRINLLMHALQEGLPHLRLRRLVHALFVSSQPPTCPKSPISIQAHSLRTAPSSTAPRVPATRALASSTRPSRANSAFCRRFFLFLDSRHHCRRHKRGLHARLLGHRLLVCHCHPVITMLLVHIPSAHLFSCHHNNEESIALELMPSSHLQRRQLAAPTHTVEFTEMPHAAIVSTCRSPLSAGLPRSSTANSRSSLSMIEHAYPCRSMRWPCYQKSCGRREGLESRADVRKIVDHQRKVSSSHTLTELELVAHRLRNENSGMNKCERVQLSLLAIMLRVLIRYRYLDLYVHFGLRGRSRFPPHVKLLYLIGTGSSLKQGSQN